MKKGMAPKLMGIPPRAEDPARYNRNYQAWRYHNDPAYKEIRKQNHLKRLKKKETEWAT